MSVILEFTLHDEDFKFGRVLSVTPNMHLELERIVPTGCMMPYVWATGDSHDTFAKQVEADPAVKEFIVLDTIEDSSLYRIEWEPETSDLIEGIVMAEAVVLEARRDEAWAFRLRFPNHEKLSIFHNFLVKHDIPIHIMRTNTLTETTEHAHHQHLSQKQREAMSLAVRRGFFATPREASLKDLAEELGVSEQAVSNRIRRGNEKILRQVLPTSTSDLG